MPLSPGTRLGPYEILVPLGAGGMGEVYRAKDARLDRTVAIKVLPSHIAAREDRRARFEREARAVSSLNHPHICTLYDIGRQDGIDFLVMEYLEGETLAARLAKGALPLEQSLRYAIEIAGALDQAHRHGIIHRDLKTGNVMLTKTGAKLLDFGLAKMAPRAAQNSVTLTEPLTTEGAILGTFQYMAPEQLEGKEADARSDIFSFGAVLYEMLAGRKAFEGKSQASLIAAVLEHAPPPISSARGPDGVPPALERVVTRCLAKDPDERWQTAHDLAAELEWIAQAHPEAAAPTPSESSRPSRRLAVAALLLAVACFALGALWRTWRTPPQPSWSGVRVGGSTVALGPRISPDGQMLAFQALVGSQNQVAVMKPDTGNWTVLTHQTQYGLLADICWARDGTRLYFDRRTDTPQGIFSVPALGGEARLVLEDAMGPQALPDGSLIVARINADRQLQLHRFWPETGRLQPLAAYLDPNWLYVPARVFPDGREVVFFGRLPGPSEREPRLYALDLASGRARPLAPGVSLDASLFSALAVTPDGKSLLLGLPAGDLQRIVAVPRDGGSALQALFTVTRLPWYLDAGPNGTVYVDQVSRPSEVLRFPVAGGAPEHLLTWEFTLNGFATPLQNGRFLVPSAMAGRRLVMVAEPHGDLIPLVQTAEETSSPAATVGDREVACLIGPPSQPKIALVSISDGRVLKRLDVSGGVIQSLAASPDGQTLYYVASGSVWSLPVAGGEPRRIRAGDAVAADPSGRDLIVKLNEKEGYRLVRIPAAGGPEQPLRFAGDLRLTGDPLSSSAVDREGRILIEAASSDSWFYHTALLDPRTGTLKKIPVQFQGDLWAPGWAPDGRIVAIGAGVRATIWRFRRQ